MDERETIGHFWMEGLNRKQTRYLIYAGKRLHRKHIKDIYEGVTQEKNRDVCEKRGYTENKLTMFAEERGQTQNKLRMFFDERLHRKQTNGVCAGRDNRKQTRDVCG